MLIILALIATIADSMTPRRIEHFGAPPPLKLDSKELAVYFTDDINECVASGVFYISTKDPKYKTKDYVIDYSYNVEWYKKLLQYHELMKGGFNLTEAENDIILRLKYIIAQYDRFPGGPGTCKVTIPRWRSIFAVPDNPADTDDVIFGDIEKNKPRGKPNSWAFMVHPNPNIALLEGNDVSFVKTGSNDYYKISTGSDSTIMTRATLNNFKGDTVKKLYCSEVNDIKDDYIAFGLKINPYTRQVWFIKHNKTLSIQNIGQLTYAEILKFFTPFFPEESKDLKDNNEIIYKNATAVTKPVTRILKNLCGVEKKQVTTCTVTVTFTENPDIKSIPLNMSDGIYFFGKTTRVQESMVELDNIINRLRNEMKDLADKMVNAQNQLKIALDDLETFKRHYGYSIWRIEAYKNEMSDLIHKFRRREVSLSIFYQDMRRYIRERKDWIKLSRKYRLDVENKTRVYKQKIAEFNTAYELYSAKKQEFEHHEGLRRDVDALKQNMTNEFIKDVSRMIITGKLVMVDNPNARIDKTPDNKSVMFPETYWQVLSHDGNLYVELK
jgi:hypothetical protein